MKKNATGILLWIICLGVMVYGVSFDRYHTPRQANDILKEIAAQNRSTCRLTRLATTPGKRPLYMVEISPSLDKRAEDRPAVLVLANPAGDRPLATEGALMLVNQLAGDTERMAGNTWYVVPVLNPDAAARFFTQPLVLNRGNQHPRNDDMDDQVDEDGPEDLNGDGFITVMRVKAPDGTHIPVEGEPRLMKRADWKKGEKGIYKLYTEGVDNDGDGKINEDGPGGVNIGLNFPHLFRFYTPEGGDWPGSEEESFQLMKFVFSIPIFPCPWSSDPAISVTVLPGEDAGDPRISAVSRFPKTLPR